MKMYETVSRLLKDQTEDRPLDLSVDVVRDLFQYLLHDSGMWYCTSEDLFVSNIEPVIYVARIFDSTTWTMREVDLREYIVINATSPQHSYARALAQYILDAVKEKEIAGIPTSSANNFYYIELVPGEVYSIGYNSVVDILITRHKDLDESLVLNYLHQQDTRCRYLR